MNEFQLIQHYFKRASQADWLRLGIGDDAALIQPQPGFELAVCSDTSVAGRHFSPHTAAADIAWKSLAVNLSDLAAMGASPLGFLLNLTLPQADEQFLSDFSQGLFGLADQSGIALIGGDTTRGPLAISMTALGQVRSGAALKRSGAQAHDHVLLVGDLGGAALALQQGEAATASLKQRLNRPQPFLAEGRILSEYAHSAVDVSDGLLADLEHVLQASHCGAQLQLDQLRLHPALQALEPEHALELALHGGDDYALLATLSDSAWQAMQQTLPADVLANFQPIGRIVRQHGIVGRDGGGQYRPLSVHGYTHF